MPNQIQILPDSLANQIAAGEVIQRPASVVKELVENAIDANAKNITINIKDAGRTLIQVVDDGIGMSKDDARMAFERHATSKINSSDDLFRINTKGFRGEALASIAAVANIELKTKKEQETIGTLIIIEGSKLLKIESENTQTGSNFSVKKLFFNIPARRKFLKSDKTEFNHILNEFYRLAIPHPDISFSLFHNKKIIHKLNKENQKERLLNIFDKSMNKELINISTDAGFIKFSGFVGSPEFATKHKPKQFFFVNKRYMRNGYFHKAVTMAYENLIKADQKPNYFIFFDIKPSKIDVNIHPTKTEINFDDANNIFQLLLNSIRKSLTEFDIPPSIDFDNTDLVNMPLFDKNEPVKSPENDVFSDSKDDQTTEISFHSKILQNKNNQSNTDDIFKNQQTTKHFSKKIITLKEKYLLTPVKSGLMIIAIKRALKQIKYEQIFEKISSQKLSIETIYPLQLKLSSVEINNFEQIKEKLTEIGFKFDKINNKTYNITATPPYIKVEEAQEIIENLIKITQLSDVKIDNLNYEKITEEILKTKEKQIKNNINNSNEAEELINKLFSCKSHQYTFDGKTIMKIIDLEELDKLFSK